jgi:hypothetical protein
MTWLLRIWLPIAVAITGMSFLVYSAVQQSYRQSLNDPQIQIAEDAAALAAAGTPVSQIVPKAQVDIAASLSPWLAIYNASGTPVASSGRLHNEMPQIPEGVLADARSGRGKDTVRTDENRVSWEPEAGVRSAIVVVSFNSAKGNGYAVAGRNMREVENRQWRLEVLVGLAWILSLLASLVMAWLGGILSRARTERAW